MRVVIELRRGEIPESNPEQPVQADAAPGTFGVNMVALLDGQPRVLNLKQMLEAFLAHRREVVTRRTLFEPARGAQEGAHPGEARGRSVECRRDHRADQEAQTPAEAKVALLAKAWKSPVVEEMLSAPRPTRPGPRSWARSSGCSETGYKLRMCRRRRSWTCAFSAFQLLAMIAVKRAGLQDVIRSAICRSGSL